ncbi:M48 family metalloprotease [Azospirillum doebereinerae]|uniref:M48 family metalloprotease n=1 Tax=Azospirillum doebereinerae TaxID=92933 RepID=UPI001EE63078|nr:M48 family metalloprotease [Azospirillum doebereinerae]MCG5242740.1 M48 family metalloprotease [Azospirillum doebereinerae]
MPSFTRNRNPGRTPGRSLRRSVAAALAALWLAAAPVAPAQAGLFDGDEQAIGAQEHPKILSQFGGAVKDARVQGYVDRLGRKLAATTERARDPWTFTVLDSEVVNAFALPGGYVYVTRGLLALAKDEAEVAGVLAHEIGHVTARHSSRRQTRQTITDLLAAGVGLVLGDETLGQLAGLGGTALTAGYSREQELEADQLGVTTLERAGYDPFAMATFLETLRRDTQYDGLRAGKRGDDGFDFFASHPQTEDRVRRAADLARARPPGARPRDPYLAAVDGMIYGDSPENGFVRGRNFAHPGLGIAFSVPDGYSLLNGADQVIAKGRDGTALSFDGAPASGVRDPADYLTRVWAKGATLRDAQTTTIGGLPAATAVTRGEIDGSTADIRLVAIRFDNDTIYRFTFLAPTGSLARADRAFQATANSFHRLTRQEAAQLQPRRIRVVAVQPGDSVEGFVRRMPQEPYGEELFRIINDLPPGTPLAPGQKVKVIEGD